MFLKSNFLLLELSDQANDCKFSESKLSNMIAKPTIFHVKFFGSSPQQ